MGLLVSYLMTNDNLINDYDISPNNILYIGSCGIITSLSSSPFRYHSDIKNDCERIFTGAVQNDKIIEIACKDNIIHGIRFKNEPMSYYSKCLHTSSYGYHYEDK